MPSSLLQLNTSAQYLMKENAGPTQGQLEKGPGLGHKPKLSFSDGASREVVTCRSGWEVESSIGAFPDDWSRGLLAELVHRDTANIRE